MEKLSNENKQLLIDYVRRNLTVNTITSRDMISNPTYIFRHPTNNHQSFSKHMLDWVQENYKYTQEEFDEAMTCDKPYESVFFKKLDDRKKYIHGYVYALNKLFDEFDVNKFKFTYNQTNYTPCHNILISLEFKGGLYNDKRSVNLQIRTEDFPFNEGSCYGRNTTSIKCFKLTDKNIETYCKKLKIKLQEDLELK